MTAKACYGLATRRTLPGRTEVDFLNKKSHQAHFCKAIASILNGIIFGSRKLRFPGVNTDVIVSTLDKYQENKLGNYNILLYL